MNKKEVIILILGILVLFAVYSDQTFEPKDIEALREDARNRVEILPPREFTTDGCSLWLNGIFGNDFTDVCIEHDIEYWKGGSPEDRKVADTKLRDRVNEKVPLMGDIMYIGVRVFGFPNPFVPWGWGFED